MLRNRVAITGMGAISPLGGDLRTISEALQDGRSAVVHSSVYEKNGFGSRVWAPITLELPELHRLQDRFLGRGPTLRYGYHAMLRAIADSGLAEEQIKNPQTGIIVGTGGPSALDTYDAWNTTLTKGSPKTIGPFTVVPTMSSGLAAKLATDFGIRGVNFSITSACATSAHCIGEAALKIFSGQQTIMFAGGSEDCHPSKACAFDAMQALVRKFNSNPQVASRAFDASRAGFVHSAGGGIIVLEEMEHARSRGAQIYAEIVGYGLTSDGHHMTEPSGEGAVRCMQMALRGENIGPIQYLNAHGTSTPVGDLAEMKAVAQVFNTETMPWISSTKSITGHALGAAGVLEAIYALLALNNGFVPISAHIDALDPQIAELGAVGVMIARETIRMPLNTVMSNSFGFGGTNACLVFQRI